MTENHETFMARFAHLPERDRMRIELAYILAKDAHRHQVRKTGERYFEHPRGVMLVLVDELNIDSCSVICAGGLHDTVEDTKYITVPFIGYHFGPIVASIVALLTKHEGQTDYYDRLVRFGSGSALIVKGADRLNNLRTLPGCKPEFIAKQVAETREKICPMLDHLVEISRNAPIALARAERLKRLVEAEMFKLELKQRTEDASGNWQGDTIPMLIQPKSP